MRLRLALFMSFLSLPAMADVSPSSNSFGVYLESHIASRSSDLDAMVEYTRAALNQDATNGVLAERLLLAEILKGDVAAAEAMAPQVIKTNPQQRTARLLLGIKDFRNHRFADARVHFSEAAYTPFGTLVSALLNAWSYAGENNLNAALHELDKLDSQPGFNNYKVFHTALITDFMGNGVRAEAAYKRAFDMAPGSLRVVQAYGNYLERQGRKADAEKVYNSYLATDAGNSLITKQIEGLASNDKPQPFIPTPIAGVGEVLFSVASALSAEPTADAAITYAQLALPISADRDLVLATLAASQSTAHDFEASNETYNKVSKTSPLRGFVDREVAINQLRLGNKPDAVGMLKDLLQRQPLDVDAEVTLGGVYRANEQFKEASDAYDAAIGMMKGSEPNLWRVYYDRGISNDRLKLYDKSDADFKKALELSREDSQVLNYLGYSMIDRGVNLDEALRMVKKAANLKPNDGYITDSLGWAYFTLKNYADATTYCERAVDLVPFDSTIAEHLGDVYWRSGRELEARFQYQHAIDNHPEPADLPRLNNKLKDGLPPEMAAKPAEAAPTADLPKKPDAG